MSCSVSEGSIPVCFRRTDCCSFAVFSALLSISCSILATPRTSTSLELSIADFLIDCLNELSWTLMLLKNIILY